MRRLLPQLSIEPGDMAWLLRVALPWGDYTAGHELLLAGPLEVVNVLLAMVAAVKRVDRTGSLL